MTHRIDEHGSLVHRAARGPRAPTPAVPAMPAIVSAAPAIVLTARVLLGERVGVGEDEDRIDADAEDEVEGDEGEDGRLVGSE